MIDTIPVQSDNKITNSSARISFSWQDSPPIKQLLDAISSIIAQEYIQIAKENPDIFKERTTK